MYVAPEAVRALQRSRALPRIEDAIAFQVGVRGLGYEPHRMPSQPDSLLTDANDDKADLPGASPGSVPSEAR